MIDLETFGPPSGSKASSGLLSSETMEKHCKTLENRYFPVESLIFLRFFDTFVKNINVLLEKVNNISGIEFLKDKVLTPTCFIKGGNSNYINSSDEDIIKEHFSNFKISTIDNAGHWLHAEYPEDFYNNVISFSLP